MHSISMRKGWLALLPLFFISVISSLSPVRAADGNKLVFAWQQAVVYQEVNVPNNWAASSSLTATVSAAEVQDWRASSDRLLVAINLYGAGGGGIYSHSTANLTLTDGGTFGDYSVTVTAAGVGAGWASVASARISIIGQDGEGWAGNYGTQVETASLKLDGVELLSNTEFSSKTGNAATGWTSTIGWQACSGSSGGLPCVGISAFEINNPTTTTTPPTTLPPTTVAPTTTTLPPVVIDGSACATSTTSANFAYGGSGTLASSSPDTFRLTQAAGSQFGAIWNKARFDISDDFCIKAEVYLGNNDGGADGLALVMQPNSVAAGSTGGGLGYAGITPSFALEFDTWQNSDPASDHIGLMYNGNTDHYSGAQWPTGSSGSQSSIYSPVSVSNIEDGQWRYFKLFWDSSTEEMSVLFDRNADGDLSDVGELIFDAVPIDLGSIFTSGNAYWGFTAATGGANNLQQVRNITYEALSRINAAPTMPTAPASTTIQSTLTATIPFVLADDSTTSSQWTFSVASSDTTLIPTANVSVSMTSATAGNISVTPAYSASGGSSTITLTASDADGSAISASFLVTVTAAPNALMVTSLADTSASGTLRWAITQANATAGGMYDQIAFSVNGTITLTSSLPQITQSVTITGNGKTNTIIDGANSFRPFNIASGRTLTISDMTLRRGGSQNGGLIYNGSGTVIANNLRFTTMSGGTAVWNNNTGSVATYTDCEWDALYVGIGGDYGSTPALSSGTSWNGVADTVFTNRTYVVRGTFTSNTYGIAQQRFTKVENSTFTNNTYGASINGLNRSQVLNSTFTGNSIGVYHSSWIPVGWNMGTDNRLISGNSFSGGNIAVQLVDSWNDGKRNQSWSTLTNNTWDGVGTWVNYTVWDSVANTNVSGTVTPSQSTTLFAQSANTTPTTTTTTTTTTTSTTSTTSTTTTTVPTTTTSEAPAPVPQTTTTSTTTTVPETTTTVQETTTTVPEPEETTTTVPSPVETTIPEETDSTTPTTEVPGESSEEETRPTLPQTDPTLPSDEPEESPQESEQQNPDTESTEEEPDTPPDTTVPSVDEVVAEVLAEVLDDIVAEDAQPDEIADAVSEAISDLSATEVAAVVEEIINAIADVGNPDELTEEDKEKIVAVVAAVIENGVTAEVAETLASNPAVLESVTTDQAEQVFEQVDAGELTEEVAEEIVDAVQEAPSEIREVFEDVVDLFQGAFDSYKMLGQTITVGERRTVVAVAALTTAIAGATATGALGGPSGGSGGSGGSPSGPSGANDAARRDDEEEEPNGEIAGDGVEWIHNISIFKYVGGVRVLDKKSFGKKFVYGVMNLGFTLAGSLVVYLTLSGPIQVIAGVSTVVAFGAAMWLHMKEPE